MSIASDPGGVVRLPHAGDAPGAGLAALLAEVRALPDEADLDGDRFDLDDWDDVDLDDADRDEAEFDDAGFDEAGFDAAELAAQDLALAGESALLRERAERFAVAAETGAAGDVEAIESVLAALRSYQPFLGERDRRLSDAAYRRLAAATVAVRRPAA